MLRAANPDFTWEKILEDDAGPEPTVFKIRRLDTITWSLVDTGVREMTSATASASSSSSPLPARSIAMVNEIVRYGVCGWSGLVGDNGEPVPFEADEVQLPGGVTIHRMSLRSLQRLDFSWISELAVAIQAGPSTSRGPAEGTGESAVSAA